VILGLIGANDFMQLSTLQSQIKMMPNLRDDLPPKNAIIFGDESADETAQRVLAVAGLMGSEEQWDVLVKKWSGGGSSRDRAQPSPSRLPGFASRSRH
jgi:hypothetical protein